MPEKLPGGLNTISILILQRAGNFTFITYRRMGRQIPHQKISYAIRPRYD